MKLEGYVEHIIYRNEENGYSVLNLVSDGEEITAVGTFHYISEGEFLAAGELLYGASAVRPAVSGGKL